MRHPVIAIGLDSADPVLLETWMSQGHLKTLAKLREQGAYGRLANVEYYKGESAWTNFLTGCLPQKTGYWSKFKYDSKNYEVGSVGKYGRYSFNEFQPFYAVGDDYRVAVFDMPQTVISDRVNGAQVLAWGAHAPMSPRESQPAGLLQELIDRYGDHPADTIGHNDRSDWYNPASIERLKRDLEIGLERRTAITKDLLRREKWDLFLTVIGEAHTAQHYFWHLSQPDHPLYNPKTAPSPDPMLEYFEAIDRSVAEIIAEAPEDAYIIAFAAHGQGANASDILSMVVLPEFLYRFSFPGKHMVKSQKPGAPLPPPLVPKNANESWYKLLHSLKNDEPVAQFLRGLEPIMPGRFKPYLSKLYKQWAKFTGSPKAELYHWHPARWYQPFWHKMKAFYIPGFSDGYIRINLKGRDAHGIVAPEEYDALCKELTDQLMLLTDPRTGKRAVKKVVRTRQNPLDTDPKLPDADLVAVWEDWAMDVIDSPKYGRIGPIYYNRTGAHRPRGFWAITGPGIDPGSTVAEGHAVDLAPTILDLMGAPVPEHMDGKPMLSTKVPV